jgi:hypothetical protein
MKHSAPTPHATGGASHPAPAEALVARIHTAGQRGDRAALLRLRRDALALAKAAPPADEQAAEATQAMLLALARHGEYAAALAFARESAALLGYDRLAASELMPLIALGDVDAARTLAAELADAPVSLGGHGLRAIVRTLLGRDDAAAADGAAFVDEAGEVSRSLAA